MNKQNHRVSIPLYEYEELISYSKREIPLTEVDVVLSAISEAVFVSATRTHEVPKEITYFERCLKEKLEEIGYKLNFDTDNVNFFVEKIDKNNNG